MKKIILGVFLLLGVLFYIDNSDSNNKNYEKKEVYYKIVVKNNLENREKIGEISDEFFIEKKEKIEISDIKEIAKKPSVFSKKEEDKISEPEKILIEKDKGSINEEKDFLNEDNELIDFEDLKIEVQASFSNFIYKYSEEENIDIDEVGDLF